MTKSQIMKGWRRVKRTSMDHDINTESESLSQRQRRGSAPSYMGTEILKSISLYITPTDSWKASN